MYPSRVRTDRGAAEEGDGVEGHDPAPHGGIGPELQRGVVGGDEGDAGRAHRDEQDDGHQLRSGTTTTAVISAPKNTPITARSRVEGLLRWAVNRPPSTAPAPMAAKKLL